MKLMRGKYYKDLKVNLSQGTKEYALEELIFLKKKKKSWETTHQELYKKDSLYPVSSSFGPYHLHPLFFRDKQDTPSPH